MFTNKPENNEGGILAKLWAKIINQNKLDKSLGVLTNNYLRKDSVKGVGGLVTKKTKSTITNDINSNSMTFTVFLHLLYNLLNVKEVTFSVKLTFLNNEESITSIPVPNPNLKRNAYGDDIKPSGEDKQSDL